MKDNSKNIKKIIEVLEQENQKMNNYYYSEILRELYEMLKESNGHE